MLLVLLLVVLVAAVVGEDVGRPHIEFPADGGGMELVQSEYNQFAPQRHGGGKKHHGHEEETEEKKKMAHWMHRWGWNPSPEQVNRLYSLVQPHKHHHQHHKSSHKGHHEGHRHPGGKEEKRHRQEVEKKHRHDEKGEGEKKLLRWMHRFGWNPSPHQLDKLHSLGHSTASSITHTPSIIASTTRMTNRVITRIAIRRRPRASPARFSRASRRTTGMEVPRPRRRARGPPSCAPRYPSTRLLSPTLIWKREPLTSSFFYILRLGCQCAASRAWARCDLDRHKPYAPRTSFYRPTGAHPNPIRPSRTHDGQRH